MTIVKTNNQYYTDIANAIRSKNGTNTTYKPSEMAGAIGEIQLEDEAFKMYVQLFGCRKLFQKYPSGQECVNNILLEAPLFDTSNVTDMSYMFSGQEYLETVPLYDTSNVTNMNGMFNSCDSLETVPLYDTSNVTNMSYMFAGYPHMVLKTVPLFDTSNVINMYGMFTGCYKLEEIPAFNVSNCNNFSYMFSNESSFIGSNGCKELKSILMYGMKAPFDISVSTKFETSDLVTILNNLGTVTSTTRLTMGSTNLAKLTDTQKAIATNKGWTLV